MNIVTVGNFADTLLDNLDLCYYGYMSEEYSELYIVFNWGECSEAVDAGWRRAGITSVTNFFPIINTLRTERR